MKFNLSLWEKPQLASNINGCELPIISGSLGADTIDIHTLPKVTGAFTYDPGFTSTTSCSSKITYIDGDQGILLYRVYPIEQLAEK